MTLERISTHTAAIGAEPLTPNSELLLDLPGVTDGLRYQLAYWRGTAYNLVVRHRLQASNVRTCAARVHITPALRAQWQQLYGTVGAEVPVPYLYNQSVGTLLYTRIFSDLGMNFRHLLHVQHQTTHYLSVPDWVAAADQELHASLRGAWRLGDGKALIATRIAIHRPRDEGGALLGTVNDRFMIRNVPADDLANLSSGRPMMRSISALRRKDPELDRTVEGTRLAAIPLPLDLGIRFGRVSGDRNPVHTTALAARVFGMPRPFLQGLGLRNALVRQLVLAGYPLTRFQMSFTRPAYLGQTLTLVMQGSEFEVVDEGMRVVTFGSATDAT
jgi:MaoC like domain